MSRRSLSQHGQHENRSRVRFSEDGTTPSQSPPRRPSTSALAEAEAVDNGLQTTGLEGGASVATRPIHSAAAARAKIEAVLAPMRTNESFESSEDNMVLPSSMPARTSRSRNRMGSLKNTLFKRTPREQQMDGVHGTVIELGEAGPSDLGAPSTTLPRAASKKELDADVTHILEDESELPPRPDGKQNPFDNRPTGTLQHYETLLRTAASKSDLTRRFNIAYLRARKYILRITEIPPSKDGRHIDLDARRTLQLLDERTGKAYIGNTIRSSRYTLWNFLPRQLFAQFSKLANAYFLCVAILQMIPGLSTTGTYTTIVPLLFFVAISIGKEGYDDLRRYRLDKEENNRQTLVLRADGADLSSCGHAGSGSRSDRWAEVKWRELQVGDIVRLQRDDQVPADLILLSSNGENNTAYIETMALDGETNLKSKQPTSSLARSCASPDLLVTAHAHLVVEDPNLDLYNFEGRVTVAGETAPLSNNEVVYRGSVLRNTTEAIGMVIYSGEECKIRMNASKNPRIKAPSLQFVVNKIVIFMVILVLALAVGNTAAYEVWQQNVGRDSWYLNNAGVSVGQILVSFIIMFNTLIPLSLYVSLEIVKIFQRYLLNDIDMYDEESDTPMEARTSTINEELGQISHIFSDKTGTLTDNSMKFRKLSVAGVAWLHDTDLGSVVRADKNYSAQKVKESSHMPRHSTAFGLPNVMEPVAEAEIEESNVPPPRPRWTSSARPDKDQREMHTIDMLRFVQRRPHTVFACKARFFLLSMALCHTCLPETLQDGKISYQAASPDELALVQAAQELDYIVIDRNSGFVTVKSYPHGRGKSPKEERYEVLNVIEFSSKRKRMSVVVRFPDRRICVVTKGADSVIMKLLKLSALASQKSADIERRASVRKSVEIKQAIARRGSQQHDHGLIGPAVGSRAASVGGLGHVSLSGPHSGHRSQLDSWLSERETDVDASAMDDHSAYSPRVSGQYRRKSFAPPLRTSFQVEEDETVDEDLVDEALAVDDRLIIERCFQHVNDFATEGLRTLLYGYRFVGDEEYQLWRKVYGDATTSLVNRQQEIERAGEMIEHSFELGGATAIEDKLQKGVPETIDKLRRAGIKLWMLTGDKRETAINIGHSCRLIKDYSNVVILDEEKLDLEQLMASTIVSMGAPDAGDKIAHSVVVVDGATLATIEASTTLQSLFSDLAPLVDSVICCRASPAQKASLVRSVRRKVRSSITLAIGDGANDIAMIQEAHVGIGITGKEGLQAARTSDYSIAQFRFLTKLLLVHGRWNYIRTAKYTAATFWKETMFYLTQALYQRYTGYTATSLYESWSLTTFNTLFSSLPVIFLGIFEKDLLPQTLIAVPELYASMGLRNAMFNYRVFAWWIFLAATDSLIIFWVMYVLYGSDNGGRSTQDRQSTGLADHTFNSPFLNTINAVSGGSDNVYPMGALTFTACIIVISTKLQFLEMHTISIFNGVAAFVSVGGWFLWSVLISVVYKSNKIYEVRDAFLTDFGRDLGWWATIGCILGAVGTLEMGWRVLPWIVGAHSWTLRLWGGAKIKLSIPGPSDAEVFQCLEKDPVLRRRFEDAARSELWSSLGLGDGHAGSHGIATGERDRDADVNELLQKRLTHDSAGEGASNHEPEPEPRFAHVDWTVRGPTKPRISLDV